MSNRCWMIILLVIPMLFASCSRKPSAILDDASCEAPCWRGIQPGKSTIQEVKAIVDTMHDISMVSFPDTSGSIYPYWETGIGGEFVGVAEHYGSIYFRDDIVTLISFDINDQFHLSDLIEKLGKPTIVFINSIKGDPAVYLTVDIIYRDAGICLSHEPSLLFTFENPETFRIKPSMKIREVSYIDPALPSGQILSGCLTGLDENTYQFYQQEWKGYGEYDVFTWDDTR